MSAQSSSSVYKFQDHYDHIWLKYVHETPKHLYQTIKSELITTLQENGEFDTLKECSLNFQTSKTKNATTLFLKLPNYSKVNFNNKQAIYDEHLVELDTCLKRLVELSVSAIQPTFIKEVKIINARLQKSMLSNLAALPKSVQEALHKRKSTLKVKSGLQKTSDLSVEENNDEILSRTKFFDTQVGEKNTSKIHFGVN